MKIFLVWFCLVQAVLMMPSAQEITNLNSDMWNQGKPRTLFARRGAMEYHRLRTSNPHVNAVMTGPRCSQVSESCVPHSRCCDPCASCHCRFFNTVCYCWRLGHHCQKKT
ncbi:agouti-related protein-like [Astyanax mexicanus]|uniref:Agouti-related protein-like n=1 Tax=Astyanax mexicanus TaxID=7994 RepID=A0A8T2LZ70_ASTMX|nr:agouti-related protein-like [Astyanax mexicanus]